MDNIRLNDTSRKLVTSAIVRAVFLDGIGYFDELKQKRTKRTDVAQDMGIAVAQDGSYSGMDSSYLNPVN